MFFVGAWAQTTTSAEKLSNARTASKATARLVTIASYGLTFGCATFRIQSQSNSNAARVERCQIWGRSQPWSPIGVPIPGLIEGEPSNIRAVGIHHVQLVLPAVAVGVEED